MFGIWAVLLMACFGCGFELSPGFAFCPRCGRRQPAACPTCSFLCEADFAFCPRCGTAQNAAGGAPAPIGAGQRSPVVPATAPAAAAGSVAAIPGEADRRPVTILFADVSGFTSLAERLDPEEVRAFQQALFEMLCHVIARYDGFVEKFVGDAVLSVFGAPVAHEDDPERALEAALEMVGRCARLSERWADRLGQTINLHIGVHTGPVVAGTLGHSTSAAYAVTGDTVNTAARLLAAASGTILVSESTYVLARHRFAFEPARELTLRGKSELIRARRLVGALAEPGHARGLAGHGLVAPMIGRSDELDQLLQAFGRMLRGRAQAVSLVGEAGTGKSRLIGEFLRRLQADARFAEVNVRRATCSSLGEATYGAFGSLFREAYRVEPDDSLETARQKLAAGLRALGAPPELADAITPTLSYLLGIEGAGPPGLEPEQLKRQIALTALTLIERRLDQGPLLIIVEDFHWADAASTDLLREVVDRLADRCIMLLFSHRPEVPPATVARAAQSIIRLAPLSFEETMNLVVGLFGHIECGAFGEVQRFIAARASGNPLFVEEIVRTLVGREILVRQGDRWTCAGVPEAIDVPPTLQGLLLSRVDRLPAEARRLLQEAAVLGRDFDESLLLAVASEPKSVEAALDRLVESDLIWPAVHGRDGVRYRFTHALVHEAVYQNLLLSRRTELHERAGLALERAVGPHPQRLADLEALAHHWSHATNRAKGADYLVAAGNWASAVYANDDAIRHYERALKLLANCPGCEEQMQTTQERLAGLLALTGRRAEALALYDTVRQAYEMQGSTTGIARLFRKIGGLHWEAGDKQRAGICFKAGLEQLGHEGDPVERAHLFQEIGRLAFAAGDNRDAVRWAELALEVVREEESAHPERACEIAATRSLANNTLGVALARLGRVDEAVERIEQSISLAEQYELLPAACRGYANLGVLYSSRHPRRSIDTCLRGLDTAKKVGDLGFQSRLYANLAVSYCALTDRCEADGVEAARKAIELDRQLGLLDHLAVPLIVLGQIYQCRGEHELAFACYEEARPLAERAGEPQLLFPCYDGLATLHLDAGDRVSAELYLAKCEEVCNQAGLDAESLMVLPFLC